MNITICSVMRSLAMDAQSAAGKRVAWSAGAKVRDQWLAIHGGDRPEIRLVSKTNGTGTHDKAVYPESWRGRIEGALRLAEIEHGPAGDPRQIGLWV